MKFRGRSIRTIAPAAAAAWAMTVIVIAAVAAQLDALTSRAAAVAVALAAVSLLLVATAAALRRVVQTRVVQTDEKRLSVSASVDVLPGWKRVVVESQVLAALVVVGAFRGLGTTELVVLGVAGLAVIGSIEYVVVRRAHGLGGHRMDR